MAPKGGTVVFLLIIVYAASDTMPERKPNFPAPPLDFKNMVRKLMMQCQKMGHQVPKMMLTSGLPVGDRKGTENSMLHSTFVNVLSSLSPADTSKDSDSRVPSHESDKMDMTNKMWNCTNLRCMIKLMRNSPEASACYMQAFVAPLSWKTLTMADGDNMGEEDYDSFLRAAKPLLQNMPSTKMDLPSSIQLPHMAKMMNMLKEVFASLPDNKRLQIKNWVKEQVSQHYFNCTRKPTSSSGSTAAQTPSTPKAQKPPRPSGKPQLQRPVKPEKDKGEREEERGPEKDREGEEEVGEGKKRPTNNKKPSKVKPPKRRNDRGGEEEERSRSEEAGETGEGEMSREEREERQQNNLDAVAERDKDKKDGDGQGREREGNEAREKERDELGRGRQPPKRKPHKGREASGEWSDKDSEEKGKDRREEVSDEEVREQRESGEEKEKERKKGMDDRQGKEDNMVTRPCPPRLMWLKMEALKMMGPYLSRLDLEDVTSSPKKELCEFFQSPDFKSSFSGEAGIDTFLGKKFLQRIQECFPDKKDFTQHVDRLGTLACFYDDPSTMSATLSKQLLHQLGGCSNPSITKLKRRLVKTLMSSSGKDASSPELLRELGTAVTMLSPNQLSKFPVSDLKKALAALGPKVKWRLNQARRLAEKLLEGKKELSVEELMSLASAVRGVPTSLLKRVKAQKLGVLGKEGLKTITRQMNRGQRKAFLQGLRARMKASELVQKVPGPLLSSLSVDTLAKANLTSLDQVEGKDWNQAQAAFLVAKLMKKKNRPDEIRKLGSAIQGMACKMIERVADNDAKEMAQAITETPRWLSKAQAGCAARKLFATLEKEKPNYFQTITNDKLNGIPTLLLIRLPPMKVKDLPDSVCPAFLDKMNEANMSSLPRRSPSRPALAQRALRCLANGTDISGLSDEEVSRLGPLVCELSPSQLRLLAPGTLNFTLKAMASCRQIPPRHRVPLIQLLKQTYGDPSDWSAETMQSLGPLLILDAATIRALRYKSWLKEVLSYLLEKLSYAPASDLLALRKKLFFLSITSSGARRKREADGVQQDQVPTVETIEDLGEANVYWTPAQLDKMTVETFPTAVETLGDIRDYSSDQLAVLQKKATEAWGPVPLMNESLVMQLGCVCQGFSAADLEKLPISLDTLEEIGRCGWNESQMVAVWKGFVKHNNMTAQDLGAVEIVALNQFICGLSSQEIKQLNKDAFKEAVDSMGEVQCPLLVTKQLKALAVSEFGKPSTWTEANVSTLGNIMAGLDATELVSLDPSVLPFLSQTSIPLIPANNFAALSASQLEALGPDNAAAVTAAQRAMLGKVKLAALDRAEAGSRTGDTGSTGEQGDQGSGAPSLSVEGIAAFMKPLLFLFLGFLLL
ncbi:otoancorin isoform X2 [Centroberyx affinis]|uniref:otoancorin isoform X2 n=1 Tax=Centroberyx affinis TaxID=166261 RepID=UPI003A5BCE46